MKRTREGEESESRPVKRSRPDQIGADRLSHLSHELTLRILSSLDVSDLARCHRVSCHFRELAADSQLWKAHYYNEFVRPRASRIPGMRASENSTRHLLFSSKAARWVGEDGLVARGTSVNWKRQFKLRYNWSQGTCSVSEVAVSQEPSIPPSLMQMSEEAVYIADLRDGLRVWKSSASQAAVATLSWQDVPDHDPRTPPTSLALDRSQHASGPVHLCVGFQDGSFCIFRLDSASETFILLHRHAPSSNGMIAATAFSYPLLATMTASQLLSIYIFQTPTISGPSIPGPSISGLRQSLPPPKLLHSLHSRSIYPPLNLCIRHTPSGPVVSIAYCLQTYLSGWTAGVQELHLHPTTSDITMSRTSSALPSPSLFPSPPPSPLRRSISPLPIGRAGDDLHAPDTDAKGIHSAPLSLTYSHPYLLVSHPDNTLTLYSVHSDRDTLSVRQGTRLWGHASRVSGTAIGSRGRAVSVAARGDEVRLWDLEGGGAIGRARWRTDVDGTVGASVKVRPHERDVHARGTLTGHMDAPAGSGLVLGSGLGLTGVYDRHDGRGGTWFSSSGTCAAEADGAMSLVRGWVGFDDETVVLIKERGSGGRPGQSLVVYDFAK